MVQNVLTELWSLQTTLKSDSKLKLHCYYWACLVVLLDISILLQLMLGHGGSSAGSYLADPTSPIPSHCVNDQYVQAHLV